MWTKNGSKLVKKWRLNAMPDRWKAKAIFSANFDLVSIFFGPRSPLPPDSPSGAGWPGTQPFPRARGRGPTSTVPPALQPFPMAKVSFARNVSFGGSHAGGPRPASAPTRAASWVRYRSHQTGHFRSFSTRHESDPRGAALDEAILDGKSRGKKREAKVGMWMNMSVVSGLCAGFAMQGLFTGLL